MTTFDCCATSVKFSAWPSKSFLKSPVVLSRMRLHVFLGVVEVQGTSTSRRLGGRRRRTPRTADAALRRLRWCQNIAAAEPQQPKRTARSPATRRPTFSTSCFVGRRRIRAGFSPRPVRRLVGRRPSWLRRRRPARAPAARSCELGGLHRRLVELDGRRLGLCGGRRRRRRRLLRDGSRIARARARAAAAIASASAASASASSAAARASSGLVTRSTSSGRSSCVAVEHRRGALAGRHATSCPIREHAIQ